MPFYRNRKSKQATTTSRLDVIRLGVLTVVTLLAASSLFAATPEPLAYPDLPETLEQTDMVEFKFGPRRTALNTGPALLDSRPDIISVRVGNYDLAGQQWTLSDHSHFRYDLKVKGFVNPPGPVSESTHNPALYGPDPIFAFVEFDIDNNAHSGAENDHPQDAYLTVFSRFGARTPLKTDRNPLNYSDTFNTILNTPTAGYTGSDFVFTLNGSYVTTIVGDDGDGLFEPTFPK